MAKRGPVPKRSDEVMGHHRTTERVTETPSAAAMPVAAPDASGEDWHRLAEGFYESFGRSGQSFYFEPSDWQTLKILCDHMSQLLRSATLNGELFQACLSFAEDMLTTEASRRRMRLETPVERHQAPEPASDLHHRAAGLYDALKASGQSAYYQPSDWAFALFVCDCLSKHYKREGRLSGRTYSMFRNAFTLLLATEASRRALDMEITKVESRDIEAEIAEFSAQVDAELGW
ncbi:MULTISPECIES: phage terminase small subunit [Streptomyces]